ncbi:unnamed protein product [Chrysoparadoxa australica]
MLRRDLCSRLEKRGKRRWQRHPPNREPLPACSTTESHPSIIDVIDTLGPGIALQYEAFSRKRGGLESTRSEEKANSRRRGRLRRGRGESKQCRFSCREAKSGSPITRSSRSSSCSSSSNWSSLSRSDSDSTTSSGVSRARNLKGLCSEKIDRRVALADLISSRVLYPSNHKPSMTQVRHALEVLYSCGKVLADDERKQVRDMLDELGVVQWRARSNAFPALTGWNRIAVKIRCWVKPLLTFADFIVMSSHMLSHLVHDGDSGGKASPPEDTASLPKQTPEDLKEQVQLGPASSSGDTHAEGEGTSNSEASDGAGMHCQPHELSWLVRQPEMLEAAFDAACAFHGRAELSSCHELLKEMGWSICYEAMWRYRMMACAGRVEGNPLLLDYDEMRSMLSALKDSMSRVVEERNEQEEGGEHDGDEVSCVEMGTGASITEIWRKRCLEAAEMRATHSLGCDDR